MSKKLKIRLLIVVWGERYVKEFIQLTVPSYLAPGNLPVLATNADLEVVVLTTRDSVQAFEKEPLFGRVNALCSVKFIYIDDLVVDGMYGVTLTLAYARGIQDAGEEQTNTNFVFANSDFILADGSFKALLGRLEAGERCIMAPSLRANAEATIPHLSEAIDKESGILSMQPRDLVKLCFENPHPTVLGKTVTSDLITCTTHTQIYWQVDVDTMLVRHHLIFMLAIKPEVPLRDINSYSDYCFVPEMVPSGTFTVFDDSDEFFLLELQARDQERSLLRPGGSTVREIGHELSVWSTKEHRACGEVDIVLHTADLPRYLPEARRQLGRYMDSVKQYMSKTPVDHVNHFYWEMGVAAWSAMRDPEGKLQLPRELRHPMSSDDSDVSVENQGWLAKAKRFTLNTVAVLRKRFPFLQMYGRMLAKAHARILRRPNLPIWHHQWSDFGPVNEWTAEARQCEGKNLFLCGGNSLMKRYYESLAGFDVCTIDSLIKKRGDINAEKKYMNVLLHCHSKEIERARVALDLIRGSLVDGSEFAVFLEMSEGSRSVRDLNVAIIQRAERILPVDWAGFNVHARFSGGRLKWGLRRIERILISQIVAPSARRLPIVALSCVAWFFVALATAANNLLQPQPSSRAVSFCTSVFIKLKRLEAGNAPDLIGNVS